MAEHRREGDVELSRLADRIAINELTARYNQAADDADEAAYTACWVADGVLESPGLGSFRGPDELAAVAKGLGPSTVHLTTDSIITIDGDTAQQRCRLLLCRKTADHAEFSVVSTGRYEDSLVRTPAGWRFARRVMLSDLDGAAVAARLAGLTETADSLR